jgi:hypothetical protein
MPIDLYMEVRKSQRHINARTHQVEARIEHIADAVWSRMRAARGPRLRPETCRETARAQAEKRAQEIKDWSEANQRRRSARPSHCGRRRPRPPPPPNDLALLAKWGELAWRQRWQMKVQKLANRRRAAVWNTPWEQNPRKLYAGLTKAQSIALFLIRTEVIGLNAWLAAIQVPNISRACQCGW